VTADGTAAGGPPSTTRLFIDLSDGINRTYDVSRYVIEAGVLRLYATSAGHGAEIELAAFAVGGWLRLERDLTVDLG
jgi:hypothetical protein